MNYEHGYRDAFEEVQRLLQHYKDELTDPLTQLEWVTEYVEDVLESFRKYPPRKEIER